MVSPLTPTYGAWLVSFFLESILYGMGLLQLYLYFFWYPNDGWIIKSTVLTIGLLETLQIVFFFASTYSYLIDHFGDTAALTVINWSDVAQLISGYLSMFMVQIYFGYCIYILNEKKKIIPAIVFALALTELGAGITQTILTSKLGSFTKLDSTTLSSTLQSTASVACDIVITVSLCVILRGSRTGLKTTNNMLNFLIICAINRGVLTAVFALANTVLFLALPGTFWFFLGLMPSSKLYMNSMLATLNTRSQAHERAHATVSADTADSIPLRIISNQAECVTPISSVSGVSKKWQNNHRAQSPDDPLPLTRDSRDDSALDTKDHFIVGMV